MAGIMSVGGLVSGLQTDSILSQLEQVERQPITRLQNSQSQLNTKMQAWAAFNTRVLAVKDKAAALANLEQNLTRTAKSSSDHVSVSATTSAVTGTYSFTVNSLASYHQITSQGFGDIDVTSIGSGTFTLKTNDKTTSIDVDNLTLEGLRNAINSSDAGVQAMIVSTGGETPIYRLVLTAEKIGTAGSITIGGTLNGGMAPVMSDLHAATDATLSFGSGANAFQVTRSDNKITDVIAGVTFTLNSDSEGENVTLSVTENTSSVRSAVQDLVTQYNGMLDFINQQASYDGGSSGVLFGEYQVSQIKNQLASLLTNPVEGLSGEYKTALLLGISFDDTGKLQVDNTVLNEAIDKHLPDVLRLFSAHGEASNSSVFFVNSDTETKASSTAGYAVNITRAATQARLTIGSTGAGLPDQLGQDEKLTINGKEIELTTGMTRVQVLAAINAKSTDTSLRATLTGADGTGSGNYLTFTRTTYGSGYQLDVTSTVAAGASSIGIGTTKISAATPGEGNTGEGGHDVVGTINGKTATGQGQVLTSVDGDSKGLKLLIAGSTIGDYGTVTFTLGVGAAIDKSLEFVTNSKTGTLQQAQDTLKKRIEEMDKDIESIDESVQREMTRMRNQFNSMEVALSKLQSQGSQLSGLISQLPQSSSD